MQLENVMQVMLSNLGVNYKIIRNGIEVAVEPGIPNHEKATSKAYIGFLPEIDVHVGDVLISPVNEKFYVIDVQTQFLQRAPHQLKAFYQTETEHMHSANTQPNITFNISSAVGSIIGTGSYQTVNYNSTIESLKQKVSSETSTDKADMETIVSLLEMIINNQLSPSKGLFSKFSEVMERHSWLSGSIASTLLGWLTAV